MVNKGPNSACLWSYQRMVPLWGLPIGKRNRYGSSRGASGTKQIEGKMRSKDFLGKGTTGLTGGRAEGDSSWFCSGESKSNAFWKEEGDWRRGGL